MDPIASFGSPAPQYGGFCCDQLAYYEPTHGLYFWVLQYVANGSGNAIRLAVANGNAGLNAGTFSYWDLKPADIGSTGYWYDQPKMSASSNYLYIEVSRYALADNSFGGSVMIRMPLSTLASHGTLTEEAYASSTFSPAPVQGATSTMYFGGHLNTSTLRLYTWPESVGPGGVTTRDIAHSPYPRNFPYSCPRLGGGANSDWCPRVSSTGGYAHDDRINSGWIQNGVIGFSWDASQGSVAGGVQPTFPYPYAHVVRIALSATNTLTVTKSGSGAGTVTSSIGGINCGGSCSASFNDFTRLDEPILWNSSYATQWSSVVPNANGDLAGLLEWGGGSNYENCGAAVHDIYTPSTSFWEFHSIDASNFDTGEKKSGDYLTLRTNGNNWSGACYVLKDGGTTGYVHPHFVNFGRRTTGAALGTPTPPTVTSTVTLTATPSSGSDFVGWSGGGCTGTAPCTVSFSAAQNVNAQFEPHLTPPTILSATVGPGKTIKLRKGGKKVASVLHGKFTIVVQDKTKKDNFHLTCPGVNKKTKVKAKGTTTWSVTLRQGKCSYKSDAHKKLKGSFKVK